MEQCREGSFKRQHYAYLASIEEHHFWFRARKELVLWAMQNACPRLGSFLEIGYGTGYMLNAVAKAYPDCRLNGSDIFEEGIKFARQRCAAATLIQMDARQIPFTGEMDAAGAFDVLEHIRDDQIVLSQMFKALRPGGAVILTVPQHPFLWSGFDEMSCHVRRYTEKELTGKLKDAGFAIEYRTSFMALLFPCIALDRMLKSKQACAIDAVGVNPLFNRILESVLWMERLLIKAGVRFGFGGSLLVVARKP